MFKDIILAIKAYGKAHTFIKQHKLWVWIIVPGILYCLLFGVSMVFFYQAASNLIEWLSLKTGLKQWLDRMQNGWLGFLFTMGSMLLLILQMLLYFSFFKYFFLIVASPLFAFLSEKTESILLNKKFDFSIKQLMLDVARGIRIAVRNSVWQTVYMLTILVLSILPFIGWFTPLLALLIECYYYGFSMLDYTMERHKKTTTQSIAYIGSRKGMAVGNGLVFYLLHLIPLLGWIVAPTYAVVAATIHLVQQEKLNH